MTELFALTRGDGELPVVLLHGFGGSHSAWDGVVARIGESRRTIAFDLPGHGRSLEHPHGSAAVAARAVLAALSDRGVPRAHWVGHSYGGATAALAALGEPLRVASLTLLAPGGFGREINRDLLLRYAAAADEAEIARVLAHFFGKDSPPPAGLAADQARERSRPGALAALKKVVDTFFDGERQKTLPAQALADLGSPVKVLWGTADEILPATHADPLPGAVAVHLLDGAGHMLPYEIPDEAADLIVENTRG